MTSSVVTTTKSAGRPATLAEQVRSGNVRAVSRLITLLESQNPDGIEGLRLLTPNTRPRIVIGVTGYPGAGKSTLINALLCAFRRQKRKVAVLAVDVSSAMTGGALLGDRIRMQEHALDPGVYIRSMATRGNHGGLARTTAAAKLVLEAGGYDVVLIETVGVGQNEADIMNVSPTVIAVVAPGLGDEVQAMKAGLLELAHIIVVNKGDHPAPTRQYGTCANGAPRSSPLLGHDRRRNCRSAPRCDRRTSTKARDGGRSSAIRIVVGTSRLCRMEDTMTHQLLTISHQIARITLHNPPANSITGPVLKELEQMLSEVEQDEYVRAVSSRVQGGFSAPGRIFTN